LKRGGRGGDLVVLALRGNCDCAVSFGQTSHDGRHRGQPLRDDPTEYHSDRKYRHQDCLERAAAHQRQQAAQRRRSLGRRQAAGEYRDNLTVLLIHHPGVAGRAAFFPGAGSAALNDGYAVAIGASYKTPDRLTGAQHLLVDGIQGFFAG